MNIPISIDGYSNGVAVNVGNPHVVFLEIDQRYRS